MPLQKIAILSITASDSTGLSGMQADVKTISDMGGHVLSVVTAVNVQSQQHGQYLQNLPLDMVISQARSGLLFHEPRAVKIGMVRESQTIQELGALLRSCTDSRSGMPSLPIVCAPGVLSHDRSRLIDDEAVIALQKSLIPLATLLVLRCNEAEVILHRDINSNEDMLESATALHNMGAQWVMLRGGLQTTGRCTALLSGPTQQQFFASYNVDGWRQHGVGGTLTAAIATRMAFGDDVPVAVSKAHDYVRSQVVYAVTPDARNWRPSDLYNRFLSLVAQHYRTDHNVAFYADKLCVSARYLSQLTNKYADKSPKQVIADYIVQEARILLDTTRLSIQEISYRLGFPNQSVFSKFFKLHTGNKPSFGRV